LAGHFILQHDSTLIRQTILEPDSAYQPDTLTIVQINDDNAHVELNGITLQHGHGFLSPWGHDITVAGAIWVKHGQLRICNCMLSNNESLRASAIFSDSGTTLQIYRTDISENTSIQQTIRCDTCTLEIRHCRIHHNHDLWGATVLVNGVTDFILDSSQVDSNQNPEAYIPAIFSGTEGLTIIRHTDFIANRSRTTEITAGAALMLSNTNSANIEDCRFIENVSYFGPAIVFGAGYQVVRRCQFLRNSATWSIGAVDGLYGHYYFEDCSFIENTTDGYWSVLSIHGPTTLRNCTFLNNSSFGFDSGAAIICSDDSMLISNCSFAGNIPGAISDEFHAPHLLDLRYCYWGSPTGPYHATLNPNGRGDTLFTTYAMFEPWLTEPPSSIDPQPSVPVPHNPDLLMAYPNPFNSSVRLRLEAQPLERKIRLYDLLGREIDVLTVKPLASEIIWSPVHLPSGIYFAALNRTTVKLVYLR
jgi:hypothetical protein